MTSITTNVRRLYFFQQKTTTIALPGNQKLEMSAGCYLVQTSDGRNILIDSGQAEDLGGTKGQPTEHTMTVLEHLTILGLHPDDIDTLICTHFDVDHAGYHDAFTRAELIVQRSHYELALSGSPRLARARPHWDHPALRYRLIDGDLELLPGLTLIETSGHVTGHQSVFLRLPQTGPVLLAIDAVPLQRVFVADRKAGSLDENEEQLVASTRKLLALVEREHVQLTVFHHDGLQWQTLALAPRYYS